MKKKAFLFAVGDYGGKAPELKAAVPEVRRWESLLRDKFKFSITGVLTDAAVTRDAVLDGYEALLNDAAPDDQLLLIGICHGTLAPVAGQDFEHAFVLAPNPAGIITYGALTERLVRQAPPRLVDLTHIVESCFSGDHDRPQGYPDAIPLFIPPEQIFGATARSVSPKRVRTYSAITMGLDGSADWAEPLIVAAAGPRSSAYQIPVSGTPRLLFTMRAIERLERLEAGEELRYVDWLRQITPLQASFPQEPCLLGNESRMGEPFAGAPGDSPPPPPLVDDPALTETIQPQPTNGGDAVSILKVDIEGICCLVEVASGGRRVVLPYDNMGYGHVAFLEVAVDDIEPNGTTGVGPSVSNYFHYWHGPSGPMPGTALYHRWHLSGHALTFSNIDYSGSFTLDPQYDKHVPQLKKVQPAVDAAPRPEVFMFDPSPSLIAAYVDFSAGALTLGPLEEDRLRFTPQYNWGPERPPRWVSVTLPLSAVSSTIAIVDTATGTDVTTIKLKPGVQSVRFGNLPVDDITRLGTGIGTAQDYLLYYRLSGKPLTEKPIPAVPAVPINSCSVTDWP